MDKKNTYMNAIQSFIMIDKAFLGHQYSRYLQLQYWGVYDTFYYSFEGSGFDHYIYDTSKVMREAYLFCYCCDILLYGRLLLDHIGGNICITIWASTQLTTTRS